MVKTFLATVLSKRFGAALIALVTALAARQWYVALGIVTAYIAGETVRPSAPKAPKSTRSTTKAV